MTGRQMASKSLKDYGQIQRLVMFLNLVTSTSVWAMAGILERDLASVSDYGGMITAIKAEWWAVPMCIGASIHLIGQVVNGDPRLPPWVTPIWRLIGSFLCAAVLIAFAIGGLFAPVALYTTVHFVQSFVMGLFCVWFIWLSLGDLQIGFQTRRAVE